ncbi:MFS transporter [Sphingosinithalassobacter portus]|uniref:MFS transporter n=1 Tax=Stakelama portus TaxID=2676234 RepID=UPI000D6E7075|nr:MFS transporter [Sphingosinithalassobacter portus]
MEPLTSAAPERRSTGFLLLCGLAYAGGVISYLPLLALMLPEKVERIAGDARLDVFTACVIAGGVAASISNIVFGWLSDRSFAAGKGRRGWMVLGVAALALSFAGVAAADTPMAVLVAIVFFQIAVNIILAPLFALMAEEIPDGQKGTVGGLLSLASPAATMLSAWMFVAVPGAEAAHLAIVALVVALCVLPLLLIRPRIVADAVMPEQEKQMLRGDMAIAWTARIFVQMAGAALSSYLIYYFESIAPELREAMKARVGNLLTIAYLAPVPLAILLGRISDRIDRRKPFLFATAALASAGIVVMALADSWQAGAVGVCIYTAGIAIFLALHATFSMQLLPNPRHRGRDLGLLNLTNTLPILAGPALTWLLATPEDFDPALWVLAVLTLIGGLIVLLVRGRR